MADIILIILILLLGTFAFNLQNAYARQRKRDALLRQQFKSHAEEYPSSAERRTAEIIGDEEYQQMVKRVDEIMAKHSKEPGLSVDLTCGADTKAGRDKLHSILPGAKLELVMCYEGGVEWVDVYNEGDRIGRIALSDAENIKKIWHDNSITGTYVAEQNCYGIEDSCQLRIIIFYQSTQPKIPTIFQRFIKGRGSADIKATDSCQN